MIVGCRVDEHVEADDVGIGVPAEAGEVGEVGNSGEHVIHVVAAESPARRRVRGVGDGKVKTGRAGAGQLEIQDAGDETVAQLVVGHDRVGQGRGGPGPQRLEKAPQLPRGQDAAVALAVDADGRVDQLHEVARSGRHNRVGRLTQGSVVDAHARELVQHGDGRQGAVFETFQKQPAGRHLPATPVRRLPAAGSVESNKRE